MEIVNKATSGVLALNGDDGYPYALPMSYFYHNEKLYFHGNKQGYKMDAIRNNPKASFCIIAQDQVVPEEFTTYFRSVIAFGTLRILENEEVNRNLMELHGSKYSPGHEEKRKDVIDRNIDHLYVIEMTVEHMTGKEALELVQVRK